MAARRSDQRGHQAGTDGIAGCPHRPHRSGRGRLAKGATVHLGGAGARRPRRFYPATVLTGVTPEMRAYREELFGPVAVLYQVDSVDEAIEWPTTRHSGSAVRCSPGTSTKPTKSPTDSTWAWWVSTPPSRAPRTCHSAGLRTPASARTRPLWPRRVRQQETRSYPLDLGRSCTLPCTTETTNSKSKTSPSPPLPRGR